MSKKKIEYKSRKGSRINDKEAKVCGKRINQLMKQKAGKIKPIDVVEDAKNKSSPLHAFFEWNDTKASYEYRLQQARDLVANIVEVVIVEGKPSEQRSFFNVIDEETSQRVYVTLKTAIEEDNYRIQLINKIITHLENTTILLKMFKQVEK